jgi:mycofactocin system creatininase family protein
VAGGADVAASGFVAETENESKPAGSPTDAARQVNWAYHHRVVSPCQLGSSTSRDLVAASPVVVIPVGSTEQHGPHLPLDTDTRIATAVAAEAVAWLTADAPEDAPGYVVAPAVAYGASGEHEGFPGTVSIGTEALRHLLVEFGRSASGWARRLVFVNGHGGNVEALRDAVRLLRGEGRDAAWCPCAVRGGDAHAGHTETSVLLHISPNEVRIEQTCPGNSAPLADLMPSLRAGGVAAVSEVGILGDPTTATADDGRRLFHEMVTGAAERMDRWSPRDDGMLV